MSAPLVTTTRPAGLCPTCGEQNQPGADQCSKCGGFVFANTKQLRHGGRRKPLSVQEARQTEMYQGWANDRGGDDRLTTPEREVLIGAVGAAQIRDTAERYLRESRASFTSEKVQRAIQTYFAASDRVLRAAQVLGLERRAAPTQSIADYIAQRATEKE